MHSNEMSLEQIFLRLTEMSDEEQKQLFGSKKTAGETGDEPEAVEAVAVDGEVSGEEIAGSNDEKGEEE